MRIPVRRNCRKYSVAMPVAQWVWGQGRPEKIPVSSLAGSKLLGKASSGKRISDSSLVRICKGIQRRDDILIPVNK